MSNEDDTNGAALPVQVYIFNQTYNLRSGSDEEYVRRVARLVDERMRQISSVAPYHDPMKVAVLAALHIADELEQAREAAPPAAEADDAGAEVDEAAAPAGGGAADVRAGAGGASSWFENIFDSEFTGNRSGGDRLSDRVSERLQTRRQERRRPIAIDADDTERAPAADALADSGPRDNTPRD